MFRRLLRKFARQETIKPEVEAFLYKEQAGILCLYCRKQSPGVPGKHCPVCMSIGTTVPLNGRSTVNLTDQEFRLLCVWASQWENGHVGQKGIVQGIADEIRRQVPNIVPLTVGEDIEQVRKAYPGSKLQVFQGNHSNPPPA